MKNIVFLKFFKLRCFGEGFSAELFNTNSYFHFRWFSVDEWKKLGENKRETHHLKNRWLFCQKKFVNKNHHYDARFFQKNKISIEHTHTETQNWSIFTKWHSNLGKWIVIDRFIRKRLIDWFSEWVRRERERKMGEKIKEYFLHHFRFFSIVYTFQKNCLYP